MAKANKKPATREHRNAARIIITGNIPISFS
jgi:hypothetical protein